MQEESAESLEAPESVRNGVLARRRERTAGLYHVYVSSGGNNDTWVSEDKLGSNHTAWFLIKCGWVEKSEDGVRLTYQGTQLIENLISNSDIDDKSLLSPLYIMWESFPHLKELSWPSKD